MKTIQVFLDFSFQGRHRYFLEMFQLIILLSFSMFVHYFLFDPSFNLRLPILRLGRGLAHSVYHMAKSYSTVCSSFIV